jgi:hypothetical protein
MKKILGLLLILFSLLLWFIETASGHLLSAYLCSQDYMLPPESLCCSDISDLHFTNALIILFMFGIFLLFSTGKGLMTEKVEPEKENDSTQS